MSLPKTLEPQFELIEHFPGEKIFDCFRVKERKDKRPRELVLRLLPTSLNDNQVVIDEFHGFFLKLSNLTNRSHIPIVYSVAGTIGGPVYVLEQYVYGVSLPKYVESHRNSTTFFDDLTEIVVRVCEALHFAHQKDIFHCCVTPDDILIDIENPRKVKLVGFGAQILLKTKHVNDIFPPLTKFVAPEIVSRGTIDTGCDIYSLATALSDACPEISFWNDLLAKSQSKDPSQRPSSAREFGRELRKLADTSNKQFAENESGALITGGLNPVLTIKTDPTGAEVWSNSIKLGVTSALGLMTSWKRGTILEIRKTGYSTETLDLNAPPDNSEINVKLKSALTLYTNPWGATVKVNGVDVGVTSRDGLAIPWDGSTIEIQKAGYKPETIKFVAPPKDEESSVQLQPLSTHFIPKRHWLEVVGYALTAVVLWLLPLAIYSGTANHSGLERQLADRDREITRLTQAERVFKIDAERQLNDLRNQLRDKENDIARLKTAQSQPVTIAPKSQATSSSVSMDLIAAAGSGDDATVRRLLTQGTDINTRYANDYTALMMAAINGHFEVVKTLLKSGADKSLKSRLGWTALDFAKQYNHPNIILWLSQGGGGQPPTAPPPTITPTRQFNSSLNYELLGASNGGSDQQVKSLLARGADPNFRNPIGVTPLMYAAGNNKAEQVRTLLASGADPSLKDKDGWTAEEYARRRNHYDIVSLLSQTRGTPPTSPAPPAKTSNHSLNMQLIAAAASGNDSRVRRLLAQDADPNATNSNSHTALMMASINGHFEVVQTLLQYGADKNLKSRLGWTALDFAKQYNHPNIVAWLSQSSGGHPTSLTAPTKQVDHSVNMKLISAAARGADSELTGLLAQGADPNATDLSGYTPLMMATMKGRHEVVKNLLNAGADMNRKSSTGMTASDYAKQYNHPNIVSLLNQGGGQTSSPAPIAKPIAPAPSSPTQSKSPSPPTTNRPANPGKDKELLVAAQSNDPSIVSRFLAEGANVNARDADGLSPLMIASYHGSYPVVIELISKGADVNLRSHVGKTALMMAARNGNEPVVKLLLEKGASVNDKTDRNETALTIASQMGFKKIAELLKQNGAKD